ncbi:MAG: hypothetical protein J6E44_03200 [Lachnospiraceae bacterium]|nr:hypothetical protein [Lachnospiraceae bacterium]
MPRKKKVEEPVVNEEPKKSDAVVATEIEVKKTVRAAARKAKEAIEDTVAAVKDAVEEQTVASEIEVKKTARRAGRKAKATAETVIGETKKTVKKAALDIVIQSSMGGAITADEIAAKVPDGTNAVYVRVDENKLYWVKGEETGSVDIWE